jgi:hypothetical protein
MIIKNKFCTFTVASKKYIQSALALSCSFFKNSACGDFYLFCINCSDEKSKLQLFQKKYPRFQFKLIEKDLDFKRSLKSTWFVRYTEGGAYCAAYRSVGILDLINIYDNIFYLDADSIIRKDICSFLEEDFDVSFRVRGGRKELCTLSGHIFIKSNNMTKQFFTCYREEIKKYGETIWYTDQVALGITYNKFKDRIKFSQLAENFADARYNIDSHVWVKKGPIKSRAYNECQSKYKFNG